MTSNQIDYWKLEELKRANLINEAQARAALAESRRHNEASEQNDARRIAATEAANLLTLTSNQETARSNRERERLSALDQELRKYLGDMQAYTSRYAADISARNASVAAGAAMYGANMAAQASRFNALTNANTQLKLEQIRSRDRQTQMNNNLFLGVTGNTTSRDIANLNAGVATRGQNVGLLGTTINATANAAKALIPPIKFKN